MDKKKTNHTTSGPFKKTGCVIMASGMGKRFGGNKLMADFLGEPLICRILNATEGLFEKRVVVTRHEEIKDLCEKRQIPVLLHTLPHRNDTVRLGLEKLSDMDQCAFCPADQPLLQRETIALLLKESLYNPDAIWRLSSQGIFGSPVVFPSWAFPLLKDLPEGKGGGFVIKKYPEHLRFVDIQDTYELKDIDRPEDLIELEQAALL